MPESNDHDDPSRRHPAPPTDGFGPSAFVPTIGDRLRDLGADPRAAIAVLVAAALVAGFLWYRSGTGGPDETALGVGQPSSTGAAGAVGTAEPASTTDDTGGDGRDGAVPVDPDADIVVHVAGAVASPGVVRVPPGSRVGDAVDSAGGGLADADLDRLNLAAVLEDGQRILVARRGDPPDPVAASGVSGGVGDTPGAGGDGDADPDAPVNLNEADADDLEELPGIGPVLAEAIIDERESRGGFRSVNELRDVRGIGEKRFEDLRDRVTV
ncbi:MAG: ComEA family DNA-binding protein [Acidimicrobiia bacterium]